MTTRRSFLKALVALTALVAISVPAFANRGVKQGDKWGRGTAEVRSENHQVDMHGTGTATVHHNGETKNITYTPNIAHQPNIEESSTTGTFSNGNKFRVKRGRWQIKKPGKSWRNLSKQTQDGDDPGIGNGTPPPPPEGAGGGSPGRPNVSSPDEGGEGVPDEVSPPWSGAVAGGSDGFDFEIR